MKYLDTVLDELIEAPPDGALPGCTLPPGGDLLRLVGQREDEATKDGVGVANALLTTGLAAFVPTWAERPAVPVTSGEASAPWEGSTVGGSCPSPCERQRADRCSRFHCAVVPAGRPALQVLQLATRRKVSVRQAVSSSTIVGAWDGSGAESWDEQRTAAVERFHSPEVPAASSAPHSLHASVRRRRRGRQSSLTCRNGV